MSPLEAERALDSIDALNAALDECAAYLLPEFLADPHRRMQAIADIEQTADGVRLARLILEDPIEYGFQMAELVRKHIGQQAYEEAPAELERLLEESRENRHAA
jgi:hypothetical protein